MTKHLLDLEFVARLGVDDSMSPFASYPCFPEILHVIAPPLCFDIPAMIQPGTELVNNWTLRKLFLRMFLQLSKTHHVA